MAKIDLAFNLTGKQIPADHGYLLYGAVTRHVPGFHPPQRPVADTGARSSPVSLWEGAGIHPINGWLAGNRRLNLTPRSRLTLRLDATRLAEAIGLAGKRLLLGDDEVQVGVPRSYALKPAARLYSRLVIIKGFLEPEQFLDAVRRQLEEKGIDGRAGLIRREREASFEGRSKSGPDRSPFVRRTLSIRERQVVGYAVVVEELAADSSIRLQELGIGGRRRFGCGIFVPDRR